MEVKSLIGILSGVDSEVGRKKVFVGYSEELCGDPGFDDAGYWNCGLNWSVGAGLLGANNVSGNSVTSRYGILEMGKKYRIEFSVLNYVAGKVAVMVGNEVGIHRSENGIFIEEIKCVVSLGFHFVAIVNGGVFDIDNVSIKELLYKWVEE